MSRPGRFTRVFVSMRAPALPALALFLLGVMASPARAEDVKLDGETFGGLRARAIGPAAMSGRIAALDAVEGERLLVYVGAAGGGVWKSKDAGTTFEPVFDKHCQSIGAIAIDRSNHNRVWVGAGESWTRNSVSVGDGIYKTTDGGDNWTKMGLEDAERIAKIAIDPRHPDTVYVAATGHLWNANAMRGVYRTRDGGKTWERVLFVNEDTGCGDLALDPENPSIVYAGMWQYRRKPWSFASGGPGSGLYKSTDGGSTWKKITMGLPAGDLGRIGIAVAPSKPNVVYASIEAKRAGIFRSEDRGETWNLVNTGAMAAPRPFYFGNIFVDPNDHDRLYKPGINLGASDDGGKSIQPIGDGVHSDYHAMWIDPKDSDRMLVGTDGGLYESEDRGANWRFFGNLPISQFYHVSYDMERPYNVYGGLQDNGSWVGPSRKSGGIANRHWRVLGGGDGMWSFVDPNDSDITYVEYQEGNMLRVRKSTGETKQIKPFRGPGDPEFRFNWNTPIHMSAKPGTMYVGSQFLFRSADRGEKWERISPDLTTNDPKKLEQEQSGGVTVDNSSAENFCTIYSISESPKNPDLIWVGTDDGNVQLTRNAGKSWELVSKKIAGVPPGYCVSTIQASSHAEGTAFATFDGHGLGDMKPYVFRTTDYGKTWVNLGTGDLKGFAHVIRQDPVNPSLLFVGTELGLFLSLDGGKQWAPFKGALPEVAVRDLAIQPRDGDLLIATHGRGIWIVDDIRCLRGLTPEILASEAAILDTRPSEMVIPSSEQRYEASEFRGDSPSEAATITYYLKKRHMFGDLKLEVYDAEGKLLSTLPAAKRRGINRVDWPMRLKAPKVPPASNLVPNFYAFLGPRVPAGSYTVKLVKGKETYTSKIELVPDPRGTHTAEDRAAQQKAVHELYGMMGDLTYVVDAVTDARTQALARADKLGKADPIARKLSALADRFENLRKTLVTTKEGRLSGEEQLREKLGSLYGAVNGYDGRPTDSQTVHQQALAHELQAARATFETLTKEVGALNTGLATKKLDPVKPLSREEWEKKQAG